jgi:hypothetical protein
MEGALIKRTAQCGSMCTQLGPGLITTERGRHYTAGGAASTRIHLPHGAIPPCSQHTWNSVGEVLSQGARPRRTTPPPPPEAASSAPQCRAPGRREGKGKHEVPALVLRNANRELVQPENTAAIDRSTSSHLQRLCEKTRETKPKAEGAKVKRAGFSYLLGGRRPPAPPRRPVRPRAALVSSAPALGPCAQNFLFPALLGSQVKALSRLPVPAWAGRCCYSSRSRWRASAAEAGWVRPYASCRSASIYVPNAGADKNCVQ